MTSREQFEAWVTDRAIKSGYRHMDVILNRSLNESYATTWVDMAWEGWQASREAVEVDLPDISDPADCYCDVYPVGSVLDALSSAGIKVKGGDDE